VTWVIVAFFAGSALGFFTAALLSAAREDEWQVAYLNCRDRLWKLERDQGGA
jgi:hypothetical protein